jgi:hypothetical protein
MFDELRTYEEISMTPRSTPRGLGQASRSRAPSERRTEALVAAYIHELSRRHRAEREAAPAPAEART